MLKSEFKHPFWTAGGFFVCIFCLVLFFLLNVQYLIHVCVFRPANFQPGAES